VHFEHFFKNQDQNGQAKKKLEQERRKAEKDAAPRQPPVEKRCLTQRYKEQGFSENQIL